MSVGRSGSQLARYLSTTPPMRCRWTGRATAGSERVVVVQDVVAVAHGHEFTSSMRRAAALASRAVALAIRARFAKRGTRRLRRAPARRGMGPARPGASPARLRTGAHASASAPPMGAARALGGGQS